MWNDLFFHTDNKTGEDIAIGLVKASTPLKDEAFEMSSSKTFAFTNFISSVQILCLQGSLDVHHIISLEAELESNAEKYEEFIIQKDGDSPFQKLVFLISDWVSWKFGYFKV